MDKNPVCYCPVLQFFLWRWVTIDVFGEVDYLSTQNHVESASDQTANCGTRQSRANVKGTCKKFHIHEGLLFLNTFTANCHLRAKSNNSLSNIPSVLTFGLYWCLML